MIIYRVYRDYSDEFHQSFEEFGFYTDHKKAIEMLMRAVCENEKIDRDIVEKEIENDCYEVDYLGLYGVEEIHIKEGEEEDRCI